MDPIFNKSFVDRLLIKVPYQELKSGEFNMKFDK